MKHSFHCHLSKSFRWYKNWHDHSRHQHTHWSLFVILSIIAFSFVSHEIGDFNFENLSTNNINTAQAQVAGLTLGVSGDRFTLNGTPQFLLFVSYFDAMAASDAILDSDFSQLQSLGFSGIRIFPNWNPLDNPARLMDSNGNIRPGRMAALINIIQKAAANNLIVDVSFTRDTVSGLSPASLQTGIVSTTQALISYRNLYFDITNEADHDGLTCGPARLCPSEARSIRDAVKAVDPQRIVSVSLNSDSTNEPAYVINGAMDFHPTHGPGGTLNGTRTFVAQEKAAVPGRPVHMQEPDRCRANPCAYSSNAFITSATDAKCAGATGWNFHTNGGYNLSSNTMFNSWLDPTVENAVASGLSGALAGTGWFSCAGGPPPPPPPPPIIYNVTLCPDINFQDLNGFPTPPNCQQFSANVPDLANTEARDNVTSSIVASTVPNAGLFLEVCDGVNFGPPCWVVPGSFPDLRSTPDGNWDNRISSIRVRQPAGPPPPPPGGGPPFGTRGPCPAGEIIFADANASTDDPAATAGYFCDDDPVIATQVTYPVSGTLYRRGNPGTAFATTTGGCNFRPGIRPGWSFDGNGQPIGVNLIATTTSQTSVTIPGDNVTVGAWTTSPATEGVVCIRGTDTSSYSCPGGTLCNGTPVTGTPNQIVCGTTLTNWQCTPTGWTNTNTPCACTQPPPFQPPQPQPPVIYYIFPSRAQVGETIIISGRNLDSTVQFRNASGSNFPFAGIINSSRTEVRLTIPLGLSPGNYTVSIISNIGASNGLLLEIIPGVFEPGIIPKEPPTITGLNPTTIVRGNILEISGNALTPTVQFLTVSGFPINTTGVVNQDFTVTRVIVPATLEPGIYTVRIIGEFGSATSLNVLTVLEDRPGVTGGSVLEPPATQSTFQDLITYAFNYAVVIIGIAVFIMIMWGGFLWLTSAANPANISAAKRVIFNAILGAILLLSSYVILYTINPELTRSTFKLSGIKAPVPLPPPPPGGNPAQNLIDLIGLPRFSAGATCGDSYHAQQNIIDIAAGRMPNVCSCTCLSDPLNQRCPAGGNSGNTTVSSAILNGLAQLWSQGQIGFTVISFTTGIHACTSAHYGGNAVDIVPNGTDSNYWRGARSFLDNFGGNAICEDTTDPDRDQRDANNNIITIDDPDCGPIPSAVFHIHWTR